MTLYKGLLLYKLFSSNILIMPRNLFYNVTYTFKQITLRLLAFWFLDIKHHTIMIGSATTFKCIRFYTPFNQQSVLIEQQVSVMLLWPVQSASVSTQHPETKLKYKTNPNVMVNLSWTKIWRFKSFKSLHFLLFQTNLGQTHSHALKLLPYFSLYLRITILLREWECHVE